MSGTKIGPKPQPSPGLSGLLRAVGAPAIVSLALVLPFAALELVNRRGFHEPFPYPLFALLWLLPLSFLIILTRLLRGLPAMGLRILPAGVILVVIAWLWVGLVIDQMPCFLGVANCD